MYQKIGTFLRKPTSRAVLINTAGNYLNVFFTALFVLILVRILTKSEYGVLNVLLGIAYVLANVLDFGTSATIYSYLPGLLERKDQNLYRFIKSTFFYQSLFSFVVIGILFVIFPWLDRVFFKTGAPIWDLYLTAISVLFFIWQNFITNILYAGKKVLQANIYNNVSNVIKTLLLFVLVLLNAVNIGRVIFVFGIVGPLIFFLLLLMERKKEIVETLRAEVRKEEFRFNYTLTFLIASQFFNLGLRMDLFLLSSLRSKAEVGDYSLAQKIILTIITTIISITQVLSPLYAKITTQRELRQQLKTGFLYMLIPSSLFVILFILPTEIYTLFFTTKFAENTAVVTRSLSLPFILYTLSSVPYLFLLYTVKKPLYLLWANIAFFIVITSGSYYLIPGMGIHGPPIAIWFAFIVNTVIICLGFWKEYKKLPA